MNKYIVYLAIIFGLMKNNFYGWNFDPPQSEGELICDGIMFLILALAMLKHKKN